MLFGWSTNSSVRLNNWSSQTGTEFHEKGEKGHGSVYYITLLTNTAGKMAKPGKSVPIQYWKRKIDAENLFLELRSLSSLPLKELSWTRIYLEHLIIWHCLTIPVPLKLLPKRIAFFVCWNDCWHNLVWEFALSRQKQAMESRGTIFNFQR